MYEAAPARRDGLWGLNPRWRVKRVLIGAGWVIRRRVWRLEHQDGAAERRPCGHSYGASHDASTERTR